MEIDKGLRDTLKSSVGEPELPIRERPVKETRPARPEGEFDAGALRLPEPPLPAASKSYREEKSRPFPTLGFGRQGSKEVEELIEVTVEEKWKEVEKKVKELDARFAEMDSRLKGLESQIDDVRKEEQKKDVEISTKIDTYKDSMGEITTKMEGMESALKGALESVLESNRSLSEAVRSLKERHSR